MKKVMIQDDGKQMVGKELSQRIFNAATIFKEAIGASSYVFRSCVCFSLIFREGKSVPHLVDKATRLSVAQFLSLAPTVNT